MMRKINAQKQVMTNIGKILMEKKKHSAYVKFRQQFKDVFDKADFN
jgi:hypothetical protein